MNLKNYTSTVAPHLSMANIEKWLIEIGASSISKQYDEKKICSGITFLIYDKRLLKTIPFNLKAHVEEAYKIFWDSYSEVGQKRVDKKNVLDQANRTAWKILSDWVEIQCSMILLGQAEPLQMFLPYMYDMHEGTTFYENIVSGKMPLQLAERMLACYQHPEPRDWVVTTGPVVKAPEGLVQKGFRGFRYCKNLF